MAKDPAFLFYPADFISGTQYFTLEEKGAYIQLLLLQFNEGKLTEFLIRRSLGDAYERTWEVLKHKFIFKGGYYWNERLELEKQKRAKFTESRRNNLKGKSHMESHMDTHMDTHMVNANEDININKEEDTDVRNLFVKRWSRSYKNISEMQGAEKLVCDYGYEKVDNAFRIAGERDKTTIPYVRGILSKEAKDNEPKKRFGNSEVMNKYFGGNDGN